MFWWYVERLSSPPVWKGCRPEKYVAGTRKKAWHQVIEDMNKFTKYVERVAFLACEWGMMQESWSWKRWMVCIQIFLISSDYYPREENKEGLRILLGSLT